MTTITPATKLAIVLALTLVALLTFTKVVPRHEIATATTVPAIFQPALNLVY